MAIDGLNKWASLFPATAMYDSSTHRLTAVNIGLGTKDNRVLLDNKKMRAILFHKLNTSPLTIDGISIAHDCGLLIEMASPCSFDSAISIVQTICSFFSFCNDRLAELLSLTLTFENSEAAVDCLGSFERAPLAVNALNSYDIVFPLSFFGDSLGIVFDSWVNAEERLAVTRDIVTALSCGTWSMPLDLAFITIAQVLESLTKHKVDTLSLSKEQYQLYCKTVLDSIGDPEIKVWTKNRLNGNNKGQKRLLEEYLTANDDVIGWTLGSYRDAFVRSHIATRNYFVHRGESTKDLRKVLRDDELYWHTWNCILIARLVFAKLMGFDIAPLVWATKKSTKWCRVQRKALNTYASHS